MTTPTVSFRQNWQLLAIFIVIVIGSGIVVGLIAAPGNYVTQLKMPDLVLPAPVSSALWLALAVAFAVAGWRLWTIDPTSIEMRLWLAIQISSWWYSPVFFLLRSPLFALAIILVMAALMVWFIVRTWNRDRISAYLFLPSFLYIAYVAAMNAAIVVMN